MDSYHDAIDRESCVKRIKLDLDDSNIGELCHGGAFSSFSTSVPAQIDIFEGISADCDSGYEASTLESIPTSSHETSPHNDPGYMQDSSMSSMSGSYIQTSTHTTDQLDTSQDSLEIDDDNASTVSNISQISGLSGLSGQDWKPMAGSMIWIQKQMNNGVNPRNILTEFGVDLDKIPDYVEEVTLWKIVINMLAEPPRRNKLRHVNTLDDVVRLLKGAQKIIVLTGAGVSVSCGIPDFRSRDGIYSRLAIDFPNLPDPQAMFDISYFSQDPRPFFKFARDIYPGKFQPSPCHRFIKLLEKHEKLLRNYTQNIDTLEKVANIKKVIECHGSFATATCTRCGHKVTADMIRETVLSQKIPLCEMCHIGNATSVSTDELREGFEGRDYRHLVSSGIMKPDIVFFGEGLPDTFHEAMTEDKTECDLLLVIGSSLKVRPVALIPSSLPAHVPQILINREPLPHCNFDLELLGDCDVIINHLCQLLGTSWEKGVYSSQVLKEDSRLLPLDDVSETQSEPDSYSYKEKENDETEPKQLDYYSLDSEGKENLCKCNTSTKCSSLTEEKDVEFICTCVNFSKQKSIISKQTSIEQEYVECADVKSFKERHMSIDSARDSGIGENSNFTDLETKYDDESCYNGGSTDEGSSFYLEISNRPQSSKTSDIAEESSASDMRGYWQPKIKKSLADRLRPNSFYFIHPSRYIFPGAEVYYDPDEKFTSQDDISTSSDSSDSESESESPNSSF